MKHVAPVAPVAVEAVEVPEASAIPPAAAPVAAPSAPRAPRAPVAISWWKRTTTGVVLTHVGAGLAGAVVGVFIGRATMGGGKPAEVAAPETAPVAQAAE